MYVVIITLLITHLSITASEQELQTPTSPQELDTPRPETPSSEHIVTVHKRQSSLSRSAALSVATTRPSLSSVEPSSPQSPNSATPLTVRTYSPKRTTPIQVSPRAEQNDPNRRYFPAMYLTNFQGKIPVVTVDDEDDSISCRFGCLCGCCIVGTLAGVVLAIWAAATDGNLFN